MKGFRCAGGRGDRERECAVGGRAGRAVGVPCAKAPLRRRNAAADVRQRGRIVSKQPVAVDETAVTGCAFATRQRLFGVGRSWRAGLNRCNRADTAPDRRSGRKPVARRGALPWRHRELHGLRVNSLEVGRRTPTGMRRLRVQERSEAIGCIYSMEWALADEKKKKKRGEKIRRSVGRAALREQSPCERSRVDRKERGFLRWKRKSKIEAAWERCRGRARNGRCCNCRACRRALAPANGGADGMGGAFGARGRARACRFCPRAAHRGRWRLRWRAGRRDIRRLVRRR